ncbi:MAG: ATPase, T2SS/T4P/T4SS family [Candidatus Paceibacterota bacterium]
MDLLQILVNNKVLEEADIEKIRNQSQESGNPVYEILTERGITPEQILKAKSAEFEVPALNLEGESLDSDAVNMIPQDAIEHYKILPLRLDEDGTLEVGFVDPGDITARDAVQFIASKHDIPFRMKVILESQFEEMKKSGGNLTGEVKQAISALESELTKEEEAISKEMRKMSKDDSSGGIVEDAPVTKIVATILRYATEGQASDVHIEPIENQIRVRFRVDGDLHTSLMLPKEVLSAVVARIKILCRMKLDEKRKPQDGRFSAHINERKIDFRVSTLPTYYGEKVVMRILDPDKGIIGLKEIGLTESDRELIEHAINRPYGMVLISGPTGSGKTTTLYSMLSKLDTDTKNVLSLEDPVEYNLEGINQSQVRPEIGYTFADGLRTALRQDPDIIMVGEIRDEETARLAVRAALTGHLVFSTIHTNNAIGVIPRLIDMGIDPYLIAPTLILAISQRLARTLCKGAGSPIPVKGSIQKLIEKELEDLPEETRAKFEIPENVYEPKPTDDCPTGLSGRTAVFEVLDINERIEEVILDGADETDIKAAALANGMISMRQDALVKAFNGEIPFEEVGKL